MLCFRNSFSINNRTFIRSFFWINLPFSYFSLNVLFLMTGSKNNKIQQKFSLIVCRAIEQDLIDWIFQSHSVKDTVLSWFVLSVWTTLSLSSGDQRAPATRCQLTWSGPKAQLCSCHWNNIPLHSLSPFPFSVTLRKQNWLISCSLSTTKYIQNRY